MIAAWQHNCLSWNSSRLFNVFEIWVHLLKMDSYSGREKKLVGLTSQRSLSNKKKVIETSDSEMDFNDVFGGPPRRASSIHEMRHSFSETKQHRRRRVDEEEGVEREVPRSPWFMYEEKPVFGQEGCGMVRRKKTSDDFYDDIFRGDESPNLANSLPGSRILSPARPSTLRDDSFASSSLPAFSLSEKLNRGVDLPAFASISRSPNRKVDVASTGTSLPNSSSPSPSRFSTPPSLAIDESRSKIQQPYRQSPLSVEFSLGREVNPSDKVDGNDGEKKLSRSPDSLGNSNHFHFSIYKWASKGPSMMVPLRSRNDSKVRDNSQEKYFSSGCSIKTDIIVTELPADILSDTVPRDDKYISVQIKEQDNGSVNETRQGTLNVDQYQSEGGPTLSVHEVESTIKDVSSGMPLSGKSVSKKVENEILSSRNEPQKPASKPQSVPEIGVVKKIDDSSVTTKAANKSEKKSLRSWISDRQGDDVKLGDKVKDGNSESNKSSSGSHKADKNTKKQDKTTKKQDGKSSTSNDVATDKADSKGPSVTVGDSGRKNKVKGKVKNFVKIFNQEVPSKIGTGIETQSSRSRRKSMDTGRVENEEHPNIYKAVDFSTPEVEEIISKIFHQERFSEITEQKSGTETRIPTRSDDIPKQTESKSSESYPGGFKDTAAGVFDDCFEGEFQVKELSDLNDYSLPQNGCVLEDFKADDSKIRKWSNGKDTNIRSLLTTLQYVLWPESGWKPVALVDIIEANSVRRSYQKALLCLHPDKLQQKGASPRQKYIAQKVFDILQEAWAHFNSLGSV